MLNRSQMIYDNKLSAHSADYFYHHDRVHSKVKQTGTHCIAGKTIIKDERHASMKSMGTVY